MNLRDFRKAGHFPTLLCSFLYFDISFMIWVLIGALANSIVSDFGLSDAQKGFLVAVPMLGGALLRVILGLSTDQIGARRTAIIGMILTVLPLALGWLWADSYARLLVVALMLGIAGASFAAALPLASRWYPREYQGLALGIAGAGNSGTALATFFAPRLAEAVGWQAIFGLALIPLLITFVVFVIFAKDSPSQPPPQRITDYAAVLTQSDTWWFCFFYAVTFGGFVGLASFLNIYFHDQYALTKAQAGTFATICVIAGSFLRPLGGYLSDRFGGVRMLTLLYIIIGNCLIALATTPALAWGTILMLTTMGLLGLGNGAVFQLVPQRFGKEIGTVTGIVGAAGGLGGFFLPTLLGGVKQLSGSFGGGFLLFAVVAFGSACGLIFVSRAWEDIFSSKAGASATITLPNKSLASSGAIEA